MRYVSTRIDRCRTEIIGLLRYSHCDNPIYSLTNRIHYLAFRLSDDDLSAAAVVRRIVLLIEAHQQICMTKDSFMQCLRRPGYPACQVFICINEQLDTLALIAGKYRRAGC